MNVEWLRWCGEVLLLNKDERTLMGGGGATPYPVPPARFLALTVALALLSALACHPSLAQADATICFYSPDTNINNLASLKKGFDGYLSSSGDIHFQPFADDAILEKFTQTKGCQLFMLSYNFFQENQEHYKLRKKMVGMLNGQMAQKKILSSKSKLQDITGLKGKTIASSDSAANTRKMLLAILGNSHEEMIKKLNILEVPKDIDAIMAINYGVAFAAVTSNSTLELLSNINPKQAAALNRIGGTIEVPYPVVAVKEGDTENNALIKLLGEMNQTTEGKEQLQLLGLDALTVSGTDVSMAGHTK